MAAYTELGASRVEVDGSVAGVAVVDAEASGATSGWSTAAPPTIVQLLTHSHIAVTKSHIHTFTPIHTLTPACCLLLSSYAYFMHWQCTYLHTLYTRP